MRKLYYDAKESAYVRATAQELSVLISSGITDLKLVDDDGWHNTQAKIYFERIRNPPVIVIDVGYVPRSVAKSVRPLQIHASAAESF
jgi:hypothetical protein